MLASAPGAFFTETALYDRAFAAFDVETTGLHPVNDRITEIGAVLFTRAGSTEQFEILVDPLIPVSPEASRVSGITDRMVRGKPPLREVLPGFMRFVHNRVLVVHHAVFDCGFLAEAFRREAIPCQGLAVCDTRILAKLFLPGIPGYSLDRVLAETGFPDRSLHRALADATACRDVFLFLLRKMESAGPAGLSRARPAFFWFTSG